MFGYSETRTPALTDPPGTIEPVFGNIRHTKRLSRFTLRGKRKVNAQWQLYCLVHNIEKLQRYGRLDTAARSRQRKAA